MRIVIVGGGLIGLSCAWHLARDRHQVTVIDSAGEAREASWAAAGMLAPHHEAEADTPLWRLCAAGLGRWPDFLAGLGVGDGDLDLRAGGGWVRARSGDELDRLESQLRWLRATGTAVDRLSPAAFRRACPGADPGAGALWLPGAQVDPRRVIAVLSEACQRLGVVLRYHDAATAVRSGSVDTAAGQRLETDEVVIASGAWTPALAQLAGIDLPGSPVKGQLIRFATRCDLPGFIRSGHYYLLSRSHGRGIVVGATMAEAGFDRRDDPVAIATLAEWAREVVPELREAVIAETWTGLRPRLADGQPRIGRVRPGLLVATGHYRNGILLAPITGEMIAATVAGNPHLAIAV